MNTETAEFKALETYVVKMITLKRYFNDYVIHMKSGLHVITENNTNNICPFHDETKPSFNYWHSTDTCYCFGCGVGGGLIQIYRQVAYQRDKRRLSVDIIVLELIQLYNLNTDPVVVDLLHKCEIADGHNKSVFTDARKKLLLGTNTIISPEVMTLGKYQRLNKRIKEDTTISEVLRFKQYAQLDLQAGLALNAVKQK